MSSQPLAGRVAVVTGGTGEIGAAICKALAQAGAAVAVGYNSASEKAEAMLGALPGDGHMALRMPVTDSAALKDAIAAVDTRHSRLDLLVNSAGVTRFVPHSDLDALDDALITRILDGHAQVVQGLLCAARHEHLRALVLDAVIALELGDNCILEFVRAIDVRIARKPAPNGVNASIGDVYRRVEIGFACPKCDYVLTFGLKARGAGGDGKRGRWLDALDASRNW